MIRKTLPLQPQISTAAFFNLRDTALLRNNHRWTATASVQFCDRKLLEINWITWTLRRNKYTCLVFALPVATNWPHLHKTWVVKSDWSPLSLNSSHYLRSTVDHEHVITTVNNRDCCLTGKLRFSVLPKRQYSWCGIFDIDTSIYMLIGNMRR
jgi:hypothetical protein